MYWGGADVGAQREVGYDTRGCLSGVVQAFQVDWLLMIYLEWRKSRQAGLVSPCYANAGTAVEMRNAVGYQLGPKNRHKSKIVLSLQWDNQGLINYPLLSSPCCNCRRFLGFFYYIIIF